VYFVGNGMLFMLWSNLVQGSPATSNISHHLFDVREIMRHAIIYYLFLSIALTFYGGQV
jgi:hypothetical protein